MVQKSIKLDRFLENLDRIKVDFKESEVDKQCSKAKKSLGSVKTLTGHLVQDNYSLFTDVLPPEITGKKSKAIERVYSKNEIRELVCQCLIPEFQNEDIINAVTDYLYGVHVDT